MGITTRRAAAGIAALIALLALVLAGCSSSNKSTSAGSASAIPSEPVPDLSGANRVFDANHDGKVLLGVVLAGPANDRAYSEIVADAAKSVAVSSHWATPIVVENVKGNNAAATFRDLAQQGVDVIIIGSDEDVAPVKDVSKQFPDVHWWCNCGPGDPTSPSMLFVQDTQDQIQYSAGYATGLVLKAKHGSKVVFLGCCNLAFEKAAYLSFQLGLTAVDPSLSVDYVPTGDYPYDFQNSPNAIQALTSAVQGGANAVYAFLAGAHRPVIRVADQRHLIALSAGQAHVCPGTKSPEADLHYDIAVRFDGGDYLKATFQELASDKITWGDMRTFKVGVDPQVGAVICAPTTAETTAMSTVYAQLASRALDAQLAAIDEQAQKDG